VLPGPLHRLTRLKEDPAGGWLEGLDRTIVLVKGWAVWLLFLVAMRFVFLAFHYVISTASGDYNLAQSVGMGRVFSIPGFLTAGFFAFMIIPVRRFIVRVRASTIAKMARQAGERAAPVDDFTQLDAEPDGRVVSLVGWVRGHGYLEHRVRGENVVGLALPCQDGMPFVLESMLNFDLLDEAGAEAVIVTGGGRMIGASNTRLDRGEDRQLLISLDLPPSAVPADWNAFVVRDGDPVMVVGTKTTVEDLEQLQYDLPTQRTVIASTKTRPLLIFPLDAERRDV
jgi:hypothetical protein